MLLAAVTIAGLAALVLYAAISAYAAWDQRNVGFPDWWKMALISAGFSTATLALALLAWRTL